MNINIFLHTNKVSNSIKPMTNKLFLLFLLALYLGLSSCGKRTKATVSFINDLKEESKNPGERWLVHLFTFFECGSGKFKK